MSLATTETERSRPRISAREGKILDHAVAAIEASDAHDEPFGHCYYENVFPEDFYKEILERLPSPEEYHALNLKAWSRANGESTRDRMFLSKEGLEPLSRDQNEFWSLVTSVILSDDVKRAIYAKLWKDIALRFNCGEEEVPDLVGHPRGVLFRDTDEYRIKPHPDGAARIVTMMYYLPKDMSQEDLGTSLYEKQPALKRLFNGKFKEVKRFPYRPNSGMAFVINRRPDRTSWHGRELLPPGSGVRNSILTQFREDADGQDY